MILDDLLSDNFIILGEKLDKYRLKFENSLVVSTLEQCMETQFGLLDLLRYEVLTEDQYQELMIKKSDDDMGDRNRRLIQMMLDTYDVEKHKAFLNALIDTKQSHLAAHIRNEGGKIYCPEF